MHECCCGVIPVCVVIRKRVRNEFSGQQEESPEQVNETTGRQKEEGTAQRDAGLVQQLWKKPRRGGDVV